MPKRLDDLKRNREQLNARIQKMEAAEKTRERKRQTRRKILVGAYHLDIANAQDQIDDINQLMDSYLKRNSDRILFGLKPLPQKQQTKKTSNAEKNKGPQKAKPAGQAHIRLKALIRS